MNYSAVYNAAVTVSTLPLWVIVTPLVGAAAVMGSAFYSEKVRDYLAVIAAAVTFVLSAILFHTAFRGTVGYQMKTGFFETPLLFSVDLFGATFNLISSFIWLVAVVFSLTYMAHAKKRTRYYVFLLFTLSGCLGVFLTGDFLGLFVFYELMSLASYLLVVHVQTQEAMKAGRLYLYLNVFGGLCLLSGILLLFNYTGTLVIAPLLEKLAVLQERYLILGLFMVGFGIKAGIVPLHIWLPQAHPVAPSPASALLSGIMIKVGAYGIIRLVNVLYAPATAGSLGLWEKAAGGPGELGWTVIWLGIVTMFTAALIAAFQNNAKRILAYSSISQMGCILAGIGAAAYLGYGGTTGFAGFTSHIFNHAFFKAGMFMMIGAIYARTSRVDITRLGGLWREFPVTTVAFFIAAAGLAGIPGFNGYISKTLLHHSLVEAFAYNHHIALLWAERIFMLTGSFTVCYITKLFTAVFFGERPADLPASTGEPWSEQLIFGLLAGVILLGGLFPNWMLNRWIAPLAGAFPNNMPSVKYLEGINFWGAHDLKATAGILGIGAVLFLLFKYSGLFRLRLPERLSLENLFYRPVIGATLFIYTGGGYLLETAIEQTFVRGPGKLKYLCLQVGALDQYRLPFAGQWLATLFTALVENIHRLWVEMLAFVFGRAKKMMRYALYVLICMDYNPKEIKFFQSINTSNFELGIISVIVLLLLFLYIFAFAGCPTPGCPICP